MIEFVEKAKLMAHIESQSRECGEDYDAEQILGDIEDFPTADVKPVVHGKWFVVETVCALFYECSQCRCHELDPHNFCRKCGADMREC